MNKVRIPVLDKETISEIAYAMENQDTESVINIKDWHVYPSDNLYEFFDNVNDDDFISPPAWTSADGYRLMCAYAHECQDSAVKQALEKELNSKQRGVFRRFRGVLDQNQQALNDWYSFKDRKLASYVRSWLADLAKARPELFSAREGHAESYEEPAGALLADFDIVFCDNLSLCPELLFQADSLLTGLKRRIFDSVEGRKAFALYKDKQLCGSIIYIEEKDEAAVVFYHVVPEYREMGLFSLMMDALSRSLERNGVEKVSVMVDKSNSFIRSKLSSMDIATTSAMELVSYNISDWNETVPSMETAYVL